MLATSLGSGQVLVKIHAAALNPLYVVSTLLLLFWPPPVGEADSLCFSPPKRGYKLMGMLPGFLAKHPYIPELDFSGTVVDPNGSLEFDTGDEVFGWIQPGTPSGLNPCLAVEFQGD